MLSGCAPPMIWQGIGFIVIAAPRLSGQAGGKGCRYSMKSGRGWADDAGLLIGRVLLAALYPPFGLLKLENWPRTVDMMRSLHAPVPLAASAVAITCETVLPLLIIIGFRTRLICLVMILYTAFATYLAHRFWMMPASEAMEAEINFFKNVAIIGGFLVLAVSGPGRFSVDRS